MNALVLAPDLFERARATLAGKSKSYVEDAYAFAQALVNLSTGIYLPGWTCPCGSFNGAGKEWLERCRSCDAPGPGAQP